MPMPVFRPKARIGRTRAIVAMISVIRLAAGFRISGMVEKMPRVGVGSSAVPSVVPSLRTFAWNCAR